MSQADNPSSLEGVVHSVLAATAATRVTIRLAAQGFSVAAEALTPGTPSVRNSRPEMSADPVVRRVLQGETVVANEVELDLPRSDPRTRYRITAEIVTPITVGGECVGVLSVHETARQRKWSAGEAEAVQRAARIAAGLIESGIQG